MNARILLADDDASLRYVLSQALSKEGYDVRATGNVATLLKWVREGDGDLVLSDVYMGDECVFDALPAMRSARPDLPLVVMSGQSTVSTALSASGAGAYDYIPKPFDLDDLIAALRRALQGEPGAKARALAGQAAKEERLPLIGRSPAMQEVYRIMARVAGGDLTILVEGETGAGKERVARAIHDHSRRAHGPFIVAKLAGATPAQITQAFSNADGELAQARHGTLYLKGLDQLTSEGQARLAALLPTDDVRERPRFIAASQRPLGALVRQGEFRGDLYYRLNLVAIRMPPLRERLEDVDDLARALLVRAKRDGLPEKSLDSGAVEQLKRHDFPGNVRELENLLRRMAALTPAKIIAANDVARELAHSASPPAEAAERSMPP